LSTRVIFFRPGNKSISILTVGLFIGRGGLGQLFRDGYQRDISIEIWAGVFAVVVLALIVDVALALIGWLLTPWTRARARS